MLFHKCVLLVAAASAVQAYWYDNTTSPPPTDPNANDQTSVTQSLNNQIKAGKGVYKGGKGVLVRTPDFFSGSQYSVVPGSFWVNDIIVPNTLYPSGNPWCPHPSNSDGFQKLDWSKCDFPDGPWHYATVAAVIGDGGMRNLFDEWDKIQDDSWGWGVFYATDANACDQRCRNLGSSGGYDCPGYWVPYTGPPIKDSTKRGAGFYNQGNPYAGKEGGGAGCHFDTQRGIIDQQDAQTTNKQNLVQNGDCECNYIFRDDWTHWVTDLIQHTTQKKGEEWRNWLAGGGGRAPQWAVDTAMCWVNNPRDMIQLQNALWTMHGQWLNGEAPQWGQADPSPYWGWNEVPVDRSKVDNPTFWDSVMIKLPLGYTSVNQLGDPHKKQLENDINKWRMQGKLKMGGAAAQSRPGSYIVFVKEITFKKDSYYRWFYCEAMVTSPMKWFQVVHKAGPPAAGGSCYVQSGPGMSDSDVSV